MASRVASRPAAEARGPDANVAGQGLLFLREEQLRQTQELFFFAWRDFTSVCDPVLGALGLGRAHHRAIHFIGARPGINVTELLSLLRVTKQSLARVLATLLRDGYVLGEAARTDRRQRRLSLTERGRALERQLFERQREVMVGAFSEAGVAAVEGFRRVLRGLQHGGPQQASLQQGGDRRGGFQRGGVQQDSCPRGFRAEGSLPPAPAARNAGRRPS